MLRMFSTHAPITLERNPEGETRNGVPSCHRSFSSSSPCAPETSEPTILRVGHSAPSQMLYRPFFKARKGSLDFFGILVAATRDSHIQFLKARPAARSDLPREERRHEAPQAGF